ncbi:hypothetical protein [Flavobacterium sp.]|uniref:hypothetical protein n=1 Tax=Flavobacterium sp. TaxID=239 RepID=UPI00286F24BD|nr:hypothetical protein [Flavobacterium sp.]
MIFFFSTFNKLGITDEDLKLHQEEYLKAFNSWKSISSNSYYFVDNSITKISDISNKNLLDVCWDIHDFGIVIPHIILSKEYISDTITGTFELFKLTIKLILNNKIKFEDDYVFFVIGRRELSGSNTIINIDFSNKQFDYIFLNDPNDNYSISDNLFICKSELLMVINNFLLINPEIDNYQKLLQRLYNDSKLSSKIISNVGLSYYDHTSNKNLLY